MLKNYLLLGFRNLLRNRISSFINIIGLSVAVGCCIAVYLFLQVIYTFDDFHENRDDLYLVAHKVERFETLQQWGTSPIPLGPALAADFPQIRNVVRLEGRSATVRAEGIGFRETVAFVDDGFFDMFTFALNQGQPSALGDPSAVIISAEMADKYFAGQNPLGGEIKMTFDSGTEEPFVVGGVLQPFPLNSSLRFDFLMGFDNLRKTGVASMADWGALISATFLQIDSAGNLDLVTDRLSAYVERQNKANESWQIREFFLDSIGSPAMDAWRMERRPMRAPEPLAILVFGGIAALMIAVSCFNYINIALGSAARRLKEIGIRKTAGAIKKQLILQFLMENVVLCFFALLVGLLFAYTVVVPLFNNLFVEQIPMNFLENIGFWCFLAGLLAFTGLVSGAYPAFYVSSFQPVSILRGQQKLSARKGLTRVLIGIQFVLAIVTISISAFLFTVDGYLDDLDWGYSAESTLVLPVANAEQYRILRDEALQIPGVGAAGGARDHIGRAINRESIQVEGKERQVLHFAVGPSYINSMGLQVMRGRAFGENFAGDLGRSVVINQALAEQLEWDNPVGQSLRYENGAYTVIGVVENFMVFPFWEGVSPGILTLVEEDAYRFLTLRVESGSIEHAAEVMETIWQRRFPEVTFETFAQSAVFEMSYSSIGRVARNLGYLAFLALFISCMGLFGMAWQKVAERMKEVGVRKTLGASTGSIVLLMNRSFLIILAIAAGIATPLSYFGMKLVLGMAPGEIPLGLTPFILADGTVLVMALASLSMQTNKLVNLSPADVLRQE